MLKLDRSRALFARALKVLPGGVNSPVRAFRAVGGEPPFVRRALGAHLVDEDGNAYVDFVGSWGPLILGHAHPRVIAAIVRTAADGTTFGAPCALEVELAERITALMPAVEVVRMVNSGTEATMSAVRLARGFTGRPRIVKFAGCYHGHGDSFLIKAGSGALTLGQPDSPGVTPAVAGDTLVARYNDLAEVEALFAARGDEIAAVIVEPVVGNMGCVPPNPGFLVGLRDVTARYGALLIFDEVMTGFRVALGGAQALYGVRPDLTTLGKIVGGGLPVGAYGGRRDIMARVAPAGPVYQAGTLSGNPLAMAAGLETLDILASSPGVYERLETLAARWQRGCEEALRATGVAGCVQRVGSMATLFFAPGPIGNEEAAGKADRARFGRYFQAMLQRGIWLPPSQFEALFFSAAHTDEDIERTLVATREALAAVANDVPPDARAAQ